MEIVVALLVTMAVGLFVLRIVGVGLFDRPSPRLHTHRERTPDPKKASGRLLIVLIVSGAGLAVAVVILFRWLGMFLAKVVS